MLLDTAHRFAYVVALTGLALLVTACDPAPKSAPSPTPPPATNAPVASTDPAPGTTNIYEVKGLVQQVRTNRTTAIIRHEEIPGYMPAMTMPLSVKDTNDLAGVKAGDMISFRMLVTTDDGWIDQIQVLGHTNMPPVPPPTSRLVRNVDPLKLGDKLPNYPFVNEFGKELQTDDYRGKAVAFTFIFTRCPFPNYCPRLTTNFKRAYEALEADAAGPKNWQLLSISFDVQMDTPPVLRAYAQRSHYKPEKWSFLTGALIDIDDITERFGLHVTRIENTFNFDHKMRTVVIDPTGRVQHVFKDSDWTPAELVWEMQKAQQMKP